MLYHSFFLHLILETVVLGGEKNKTKQSKARSAFKVSKKKLLWDGLIHLLVCSQLAGGISFSSLQL